MHQVRELRLRRGPGRRCRRQSCAWISASRPGRQRPGSARRAVRIRSGRWRRQRRRGWRWGLRLLAQSLCQLRPQRRRPWLRRRLSSSPHARPWPRPGAPSRSSSSVSDRQSLRSRRPRRRRPRLRRQQRRWGLRPAPPDRLARPQDQRPSCRPRRPQGLPRRWRRRRRPLQARLPDRWWLHQRARLKADQQLVEWPVR